MKALTLTPSARLAAPHKATLRPRAQKARPMRASRLICRAADAGQVLSDVRSIIAEQLGTDMDKVQAESKFVDLGADSLDTVEIMMAIEEKFDTKIDEEEAPKLATVKDVADLITKQMG